MSKQKHSLTFDAKNIKSAKHICWLCDKPKTSGGFTNINGVWRFVCTSCEIERAR